MQPRNSRDSGPRLSVNGSVDLITRVGQPRREIPPGKAGYAGDEDLAHQRLPQWLEGLTGAVSAKIGFDHDPAQLLEARLGLPPKDRPCLGRVADEEVDLGRSIKTSINPRDDIPGRCVDRR